MQVAQLQQVLQDTEVEGGSLGDLQEFGQLQLLICRMPLPLDAAAPGIAATTANML
jgi:hypothetical protein